MKTTVLRPIEIDIARIKLQLPVWYDEEEIPNDFPFRDGERWDVTIDVDTGKIIDWPQGRSHKLHLTVKDGGVYVLLDRAGKEVAKRENNYVPHGIIPGSYGDTVELNIAVDGTIANWKKGSISVAAFFSDESED